jgi:membrane fusion protein (multidrug efflux system)
VSPNIRPATRDLVIEALVPNGDGRLRPGMFAVAKLEVGEQAVPTVPPKALREESGTLRVFVVKDHRIEERPSS